MLETHKYFLKVFHYLLWKSSFGKWSLQMNECQKGSQVNPTATPISTLVKGNRQMEFQVDRVTKKDFLVLVKGGCQKGSQVNPTVTLILALVKGNRQMRFQVDRATNIDFLFWLKEVARRDFRLTQLQH